MIVISVWLTFQDLGKLKTDITKHILPSHLRLHLSYITVSCQCPNHNAIKSQKISEDIKDSDDDFNLSQTYMSLEPHFPSQQEVDNLVRDLGLTKSNAELLTSRLKEWNLLDTSCRCSSLKKRHERFSKYFSMVGSLCFCNNVDNLFEELGIVHDPKEGRLFIGSSS